MKNIRKGNDIHAYWRIFDGAGADYSLEGKNIALHLKDVLGHEMTLSNVSITGSVIEFYFFGKNQTTPGKHALILVENEGLEGMHTIDIVDAFALVSHTFQEGGDNACSHIRTETIRLSGTINAGHAGSPGAAAGFGEVTAEINNNTGTPSVEVETSGPDTAKNFHFSFKNLKGAKGDPGSDATVTSESIANALGYTPANTNDVPTALSDLSEDTTHRVVTDAEKTAWGDKYDKPSGGIPASDMTSGVQSSLGKADTAVQPARVQAIEDKIPAAASQENQLADKAFVNSSVATATATFQGTYNLVSDLSLTLSATQEQIAAAIATKLEALTPPKAADNNDYVFVQIPTANDKPTEIARVDRYKYNGSAWAYEWSLNNSSFTSAQWAALNSGITSDLVTKLGALPSAADLAAAFAGKVDKVDGKGLSTNDYTTEEKTKLGALPTNAELLLLLLAKANKSNVDFIEQSFGKYDSVREIALVQGKSGKYVNVGGSETTASGYGISTPIEMNKGDILLVPSASAVPADVSVVARVVTRTYDKVVNYAYTYQQANPELYETATADYDSSLVYTAVYDTTGETPVLTGWTKGGQTYETLPATHEVTESYYEPLMQQVISAMPSTGYYIYLCPQTMTVVVSGYTATVDGGVCKVVGWGIFKNIATNFVGVPGQSVLAQALCDLEARLAGISKRLENLGDTKAKCIDFEDVPKVCDAPMVIEGTGAPSVLPRFVGQRYHDTTPNAKHLYEAFAVTGSTADWVLIK